MNLRDAIVVGDVVKLKSGGRKMTVEAVDGYTAKLVFFKLKEGQQPPACYGPVYEDEPTRMTLPLATLEKYR